MPATSLACQSDAHRAVSPLAALRALAEKFCQDRRGHLGHQDQSDAANKDVHCHLGQDSVDALAARDVDHSAVAGFRESYPALVHGYPFEWAWADEGAA